MSKIERPAWPRGYHSLLRIRLSPFHHPTPAGKLPGASSGPNRVALKKIFDFSHHHDLLRVLILGGFLATSRTTPSIACKWVFTVLAQSTVGERIIVVR